MSFLIAYVVFMLITAHEIKTRKTCLNVNALHFAFVQEKHFLSGGIAIFYL